MVMEGEVRERVVKLHVGAVDFVSLVFFFQAEDGIRDTSVTGVQTCALPISVSLRAFASFLRQYPNATLTIAGEGPLLEDLQRLSRELKIDNRVSFTGFISQEELRDLFYASHIFLHPSETAPDGNQEGIPNSMLEAMASGLPVF